ncbi:MAG: UMP kinase [archaeon]
MKKKVLVISLGGSLIVPNKMDLNFLHNFRKTLKKHYKTHKFVVICGGGAIARKYILVLRKQDKPKKQLSLAGIRATRMNAKFVMQLFGKEANDTLPITMIDIKNNLPKNNVVISGALRYDHAATSDTTAAKLAKFLNTSFINMTNTKGFYSANPKTHKNAKFIPNITWKNFHAITSKMKFKAGQNFVLDQHSARIIKKHKIPTYIIEGNNLADLENIIKGKKFTGTLIAN